MLMQSILLLRTKCVTSDIILYVHAQVQITTPTHTPILTHTHINIVDGYGGALANGDDHTSSVPSVVRAVRSRPLVLCLPA